AGELNACEPVKELAHEASNKLLTYYLNFAWPKREVAAIEIAGFHFTFTQQKEIQKLIQKLCIKFHNSLHDWLHHPVVKELQEQELLPKQRTKELTNFLRQQLDPFAYNKQQFLTDCFAPLRQEQIDI